MASRSDDVSSYAGPRAAVRVPPRQRPRSPDDRGPHDVEMYAGPKFQRSRSQSVHPIGEPRSAHRLSRKHLLPAFSVVFGGPGASTAPHELPEPPHEHSDEDLREDVCDFLAGQGWVDVSDVEVFVEHGVVRLEGTVRSRSDRYAVEDMIQDVHGVCDVLNRLQVAGPDALEDNW